MKIPNTIKIGWRNYLIKKCSDRRNDKGQLLAGQINYDDHIIYLDDDVVHPKQQQLSFLHEVIHGIFQMQGQSEWRTNEDLVEAISEGLFQVIDDNPDLFK